jgi:hypothetical protein
MQQGASTETYTATVNHRVTNFSEPVPEGRKILSAAGFEPADDHVLIQLLRHGTRSIGLDEPVDLREQGREAFEAFRSDRIYRFTIDERGYDWGAGQIKEPQLRQLAAVPEDEVLFLEHHLEDGPDLGPDDELTLTGEDTQHLRTAKRLVTVTLDGVEKKIPRGVYTTEQLIYLLGVPAGYLLNVINAAGQLETLKPGQRLRVKPGMKFFSQVPCGGSA